MSHFNCYVPNLRFNSFFAEYERTTLNGFLKTNKVRNKEEKFSKSDVLSVSGELGVINQIEHLGRSYAGESVALYHILRTGQIVYTKSPLAESPYGIIKLNRNEDGIVSTLYAVYDVLNKADCRYIEHYFAYKPRLNNYLRPIVRIGAKHDMKIGNDEVLKNYVNFPSKEEQQKISDFLDLINQRIDTQNKIIDKLESLKIQIKERIFNLGTIKKTISDVLIENNKKSIIQDQYPVLSSTVKGLFLQSDYFEREVASSNNIGYKIVKKGQIIISPQNLWMGNITYNDTFENGIVSPSYKVFDITTKYFKNYIYWILTSKHSFFNFSLVSEQGASIVRRNLNYDSFLNLTLPLCDEEQQKHISKLIDLIETKLKLEKRKFELFLNQKNYLLSNLFI